MRKVFTFLLPLCIATSSFSQILYTENFNYGSSAGSLISLSGGKWVENTNASATNIVQYDQSGSLSFTNFTSSGGKVNFLNTGQDLTSALSTSASTGNVYAAMLVNFSAAQTQGDYFFHFMPTTTTNSFYARLFVKLNGSNINFGLMKNNGGATPYATNGYNLNTTYCLVLKYAFIADGGTNDVATLYVFDAATGLPASEPISSEISVSANTDATGIGAIALRQGTSTAAPSGSIDNIVVSTTWTSLVSALPVNLTHFNSKIKDKIIEINWQSSNETNFDYYLLEKSYDGISFSTIGKIKGNSTNGIQANYSFFDAALISPKQYYRLKMVDKDGSTKYSQIIFQNALTAVTIKLYPNPVANTIVATHPSSKEGTVLQVYNVEGKMIKNIIPILGTTQTSFSIDGLLKGSYVLIHKFKEVITSFKFIK